MIIKSAYIMAMLPLLQLCIAIVVSTEEKKMNTTLSPQAETKDTRNDCSVTSDSRLSKRCASKSNLRLYSSSLTVNPSKTVRNPTLAKQSRNVTDEKRLENILQQESWKSGGLVKGENKASKIHKRHRESPTLKRDTTKSILLGKDHEVTTIHPTMTNSDSDLDRFLEESHSTYSPVPSSEEERTTERLDTTVFNDIDANTESPQGEDSEIIKIKRENLPNEFKQKLKIILRKLKLGDIDNYKIVNLSNFKEYNTGKDGITFGENDDRKIVILIGGKYYVNINMNGDTDTNKALKMAPKNGIGDLLRNQLYTNRGAEDENNSELLNYDPKTLGTDGLDYQDSLVNFPPSEMRSPQAGNLPGQAIVPQRNSLGYSNDRGPLNYAPIEPSMAYYADLGPLMRNAYNNSPTYNRESSPNSQKDYSKEYTEYDFLRGQYIKTNKQRPYSEGRKPTYTSYDQFNRGTTDGTSAYRDRVNQLQNSLGVNSYGKGDAYGNGNGEMILTHDNSSQLYPDSVIQSDFQQSKQEEMIDETSLISNGDSFSSGMFNNIQQPNLSSQLNNGYSDTQTDKYPFSQYIGSPGNYGSVNSVPQGSYGSSTHQPGNSWSGNGYENYQKLTPESMSSMRKETYGNDYPTQTSGLWPTDNNLQNPSSSFEPRPQNMYGITNTGSPISPWAGTNYPRNSYSTDSSPTLQSDYNKGYVSGESKSIHWPNGNDDAYRPISTVPSANYESDRINNSPYSTSLNGNLPFKSFNGPEKPAPYEQNYGAGVYNDQSTPFQYPNSGKADQSDLRSPTSYPTTSYKAPTNPYSPLNKYYDASGKYINIDELRRDLCENSPYSTKSKTYAQIMSKQNDQYGNPLNIEDKSNKFYGYMGNKPINLSPLRNIPERNEGMFREKSFLPRTASLRIQRSQYSAGNNEESVSSLDSRIPSSPLSYSFYPNYDVELFAPV